MNTFLCLRTAVATLLSVAALPAAWAQAGGERLPVTIYEFRSGVAAVNGAAATDMFKTALVKTGRFRVVERARLNEGVVREKQLNAGGRADGQAGLLLPAQDEALTVRATRTALAKLDADPARLLN